MDKKQMKDEMLKLDNQLCFTLYASSKALIKQYKPLLKKLGITYTQYITLLVLWEQDYIMVKELGKKLYLDSGTLTPLLKRLEGMGILERIRDAKDERNVFVKLTQKGKGMKNDAYEIPQKLVCSMEMNIDNLLDLKVKLEELLKNIN